MDLGISGRTALVCGSSTGLGFAIARALAAEGCRVALNGRGQDRLDAAVARLAREHPGLGEGFRADVSVPEEAQELVRSVADRLGPPDIVVANAAGPPAAPFEDLGPGTWQQALDLNLLSTMHLCRTALPAMRARRWGRIVCLTSIAAKQPLGGLILSTTARAGVLGFAKSLADETAGDGITVNAVCPGFMRTDRLVDLADQRSAKSGRSQEEELADMVRGVPARKVGDPADLAAAVTFLASERAGYITGVALAVDGGFLRSIL